MKHQIRVDLQGSSDLARHHQYYFDKDWRDIRRIGENLCRLWQMDVCVYYSGVDVEGDYRTETLGHFRYERSGTFEPVPIKI